jgi:hypothetical protein
MGTVHSFIHSFIHSSTILIWKFENFNIQEVYYRCHFTITNNWKRAYYIHTFEVIQPKLKIFDLNT